MPFLIALILIFLIQWFHLRLLRLELPEGAHRLLPWGLGLLHLPLVIFAGMRIVGLGGHGALVGSNGNIAPPVGDARRRDFQEAATRAVRRGHSPNRREAVQ